MRRFAQTVVAIRPPPVRPLFMEAKSLGQHVESLSKIVLYHTIYGSKYLSKCCPRLISGKNADFD